MTKKKKKKLITDVFSGPSRREYTYKLYTETPENPSKINLIAHKTLQRRFPKDVAYEIVYGCVEPFLEEKTVGSVCLPNRNISTRQRNMYTHTFTRSLFIYITTVLSSRVYTRAVYKGTPVHRRNVCGYLRGSRFWKSGFTSRPPPNYQLVFFDPVPGSTCTCKSWRNLGSEWIKQLLKTKRLEKYLQ